MYISAMADIFIGYASRNRETIERLADAIEAAGYTVWWDRQIVGGAEFSKDIERELDAAKAVIIAWSEAASESPWVKDEAAVARDQGKLVPVSLDAGIPPMGFRQYQAVDFSGWNGRADHRALKDVLRGIEARLSGVEPQPASHPATHTTTSPASKTSKRRILVAGAFAMAMVVAYAALQFRNPATESARSAEPAGEQAAPDAIAQGADTEPRIAVAPIRVRGTDPQLEDFAASLGEDIASGLSRFSYLLVSSQIPAPEQPVMGAAYLLEGTLRRSGDTLRLSTQLLNVANGQQVWGETFDRSFDATTVLETQDDLTDRVVASVADPYGALMRDLSRAVVLKTPEQMTPYETILRHFIYRQRIGAEDHLETRAALERGVEQAPGNADVWASLAAIYAEEYKHEFNPRPDSLERALEAARKAVDLEPDNAYANFALAEVHFFSQDVGAFRAAAERAIALNPRDSDAMAMIGIMVGYTGDWTRSVELTTRAMGLNATHPGWYRFNILFNEYRQQHYAEALAQAERINMPDYFADPYARAMTHAQLGNSKEAQKALDEFRALWPGVNLHYLRESHLNKWFYAQPDLIELCVDGLRKAGLEEGE